jgi:hypothetical protein
MSNGSSWLLFNANVSIVKRECGVCADVLGGGGGLLLGLCTFLWRLWVKFLNLPSACNNDSEQDNRKFDVSTVICA